VARDQVDEAVARLRRFERGPGADHRADTRADRRDRPDPRDGHDGGDRLERADLDDLADRSGRHARRHRRDREDRSLVRPPTTPLVPPSAMQPSARDRDDKGHKKR
jgi:hypothetical protein